MQRLTEVAVQQVHTQTCIKPTVLSSCQSFLFYFSFLQKHVYQLQKVETISSYHETVSSSPAVMTKCKLNVDVADSQTDRHYQYLKPLCEVVNKFTSSFYSDKFHETES